MSQDYLILVLFFSYLFSFISDLFFIFSWKLASLNLFEVLTLIRLRSEMVVILTGFKCNEIKNSKNRPALCYWLSIDFKRHALLNQIPLYILFLHVTLSFMVNSSLYILSFQINWSYGSQSFWLNIILTIAMMYYTVTH